jgi:hypothetical protein
MGAFLGVWGGRMRRRGCGGCMGNKGENVNE